MYRKLIQKSMVLILCLIILTGTAVGARVEINGTELSEAEGWIKDGISYVTLRAVEREGGYSVSWDGQRAGLSGKGAELTAKPGAAYIEVNGRALYIPGGVQVISGRTVLPVRVLGNALGAEVSWNDKTATASLSTRSAKAPSANYNAEDLYWLSRVISAESRGETLWGQMAVGNVVLNRVKSQQFPNTVKGVVFDRKHGVQFEPVENGTIYEQPTATSILAAKLALEGTKPVGNCLYFYAPALSKGTWIVNNRTYYTTIGCHKFYL